MKNLMIRVAVLCLMLGSTSIFLTRARAAEAPLARTSFDSFPMTLQSWSAVVNPPFEKDILDVLGVDDYTSRVYYKPDGAAVGLYMGYYNSQRQGDTIHSPMNCLPGAGWEPVVEGRKTITNADGAGRDITVNRYVVQKGLDRQLVLYWYHGRGRVVASEYWSKLFLINDAMRSNRTDGALVRVIAPIRIGAEDDGAAAEQLAEEFVRALFPILPSYLPD